MVTAVGTEKETDRQTETERETDIDRQRQTDRDREILKHFKFCTFIDRFQVTSRQ